MDTSYKKVSGIYLIRNLINNKIYIGSATSLYHRWSGHQSYLRQGKHHSKFLQRSYNKYGSDNFSYEVIEFVVNKEDLLKREQVWIDFFKPEYNVCKVAGSSRGRINSEEYKKKMSERLKGRVFSKEHRENLALAAQKRKTIPGWKKGKKKVIIDGVINWV